MKDNITNDINSSDNVNVIHVNLTKNKSLLSKKRKPEIKKEKYIDNIRRLIMESGIDKNFLKSKLFPENDKEKDKNNNIKEEKSKEKEKENKIVVKEDIKKKINTNNHVQQYNALKEWCEKINFLPKEEKVLNKIILDDNEDEQCEILNWQEKNNNIINENEKGKIIFNDSQNNKTFPHYIYLKNDFSFNISLKNKIYSWKIKFLSTSNLIGVGLAYKDIVIKNENKFLVENNTEFINGVFALFQTYNPQIKKFCIRPWNCLDKKLINYVANFPSFKKGKEIIIKYNTNKERIEFKIKNSVHIMGGIKLVGKNNINNNNMILTPCVVFYKPGDEVLFSEFIVDDIIQDNSEYNDDNEIIIED